MSDLTLFIHLSVDIIKMFEFQPHKAPPAAVNACCSAFLPAEYLKCSVMVFQALNQARASKNAESCSIPPVRGFRQTAGYNPIFHHKQSCEPCEFCPISNVGADLPSAARHSARAGWGVPQPMENSRKRPNRLSERMCDQERD